VDFLSIFKNLFDSNRRELRKLNPLVQKVSSLEDRYSKMSDADLSSSTNQFKERIENGESPDRILPEAFAVVREASKRILGLRPFDCQILGGIVLHQGRIAEMQTGEGKTLVATLPSYLNAVSGRKVYVVTVNDYLARRDRDWMGQVHRFLGLDVGLVVPAMETEDKRKSYGCPIVYGTNTELGFDYLRDHMAWRKSDIVQSELDYGIIDEVDSILIDEARTPLIISGRGEGSVEIYVKFRELAAFLKKDRDYTVDEKARIVALTEDGEKRAEDYLGMGALNSEENIGLYAHIRQALTAKELMQRDVDYVVKDGEVLIVDEFTGRILPGRRFSDGLHQAIEAKEGVKVREQTDTLATITVQNFFRMFKKLSGMTGTALTEEPEFREIYGLDVVSIPTNKPLVRESMPDSIWKTERAKFGAVVEEIAWMHEKGRPVLVGTRSIEKSELLSAMLRKKGVPHEVLNAKYHEREAEIVAQAGRKGAVTIATNMAGRGTDILLGGNPEFMAKRALRKDGYPVEVIAVACEKVLPQDIQRRIDNNEKDEFIESILNARKEYQEHYEKAKRITDAEHDEVVTLGGLHVLGTERHESRRIDNQLRGRAGRQGDPGSSRFYLSLEDELMRLFGGDLVSSIMDKAGFTEEEAIEHPLISKAVETAQKRIESQHFSIRKRVLEYDNVLNRQRQVIYEDRMKVLTQDDVTPIVRSMAERVVERAFDVYWPANAKMEEVDWEGLKVYIHSLLPEFSPSVSSERDGLKDQVLEAIWAERDRKASILESHMNDFQRQILLRVSDQHWVQQLRTMEDLREGIGLQAYGGKDPLVEYTRQGYELFTQRIQNIEEDTVTYLCKIQIKRESKGVKGPSKASSPRTNETSKTFKRTKTSSRPLTTKKIGRNEPCPCGSGKKYKNCCGKLA
jgi:preprotein translocase subunit SecA